jgi:hypothetical protein
MLTTFTQDMVCARGFKPSAVFNWSEHVVFSEQSTDLVGRCTLASKHGCTYGFFNVCLRFTSGVHCLIYTVYGRQTRMDL